MFFRIVYKSGQIFLPFCHNTRVWQTDGRTDGRTEFSSLDRVCIPCSAVKSTTRLPFNGRQTTRNTTHRHTFMFRPWVQDGFTITIPPHCVALCIRNSASQRLRGFACFSLQRCTRRHSVARGFSELLKWTCRHCSCSHALTEPWGRRNVTLTLTRYTNLTGPLWSKTYLHTKNDLTTSRLSKVSVLQKDGQYWKH